jgi:hypothetical protein
MVPSEGWRLCVFRIANTEHSFGSIMMWDKDNHIIGIKGISKKDERAYSLRFAKKGNGAGFAAKAFLQYISYDLSLTRSFDCVWDDEQNMFEIPIPDDAIKAVGTAARQSRLPIKGVRIDEAKGQSRASA